MKKLQAKLFASITAAYTLALNVCAEGGTIETGLSSAKNEAESTIKSVVNTFVTPIAEGIALVAFLIFVIMAVFKHRQGDDVRNSVTLAVVMLMLIALLHSWSTWGWALIGW